MFESDRLDAIIDNYSENHRQFGYGARALEMPSDRRTIRYYELLKNFPDYNNKEKISIIDLGCGYGDLVDYLDYLELNYNYIGVDLCDSFLNFAKKKYAGRDNIIFVKRNFFENDYEEYEFDYAVSSQTFNSLYSNKENNMDVIQKTMKYAFLKCKKGIAFNFVTNKVEYKKKNVAYHSVEELVSFSYSLSNSIVLDNSCMPFEATICILKDKSTDGLILDSFHEKHVREFKNGVFNVIKK